jgi:hypothetical protein
MTIPGSRSARTERSLAEKVAMAAMLSYARRDRNASRGIPLADSTDRHHQPGRGAGRDRALLGRWRWGPLLAPIVSLGVIAWAFPFTVLDLTHPEMRTGSSGRWWFWCCLP